MTFVKRKERVDGKLVEVCRIDGRRVGPATYAVEMLKAQGRHLPPPKVKKGQLKKAGGWPMRSIALAVHPNQVKEAIASAQKRGVPTDFTRDGRPVFTDRDHYNRYMRAYHFYNRDAGFGDAAPGQSRHSRG
jgi:hypothetical protein